MESYCTCSILGKKHPSYSKVETTEIGKKYKTTNCSEPYRELQTSGWNRMKIPMVGTAAKGSTGAYRCLLAQAISPPRTSQRGFISLGDGPVLFLEPWIAFYTPWMSTDENKVPFYPTSLCFCR